MTYLNAKKYISSAPEKTSDSCLMFMLDSLGNPQKRTKFLRLAGSNGKTVCAEMLSSIVKHASYTVGCLRMPLREEPRDNICIGGTPIGMDEFTEHTQALKILCLEHKLHPTGSELLLCVALLAFKRAECQLCIIESDHIGTDPSRMLPTPFAAIICGTIPNDDTVEISRIRSYICTGIHEIVSAPQNSQAYNIISKTCYSVNCRLTLPVRSAITVHRLNFRGCEFTYKGTPYTLNLCGQFQIYNAVLALESVEMLNRHGFKIPTSAIREGLESLKIPSKFEVISISPLIIVDSTHTPEAIETVCDSLSDLRTMTGSKIRLCLPKGEIIDRYINALSARDYNVEKVLTLGAPDSDGITEHHKTLKSLIKSAIGDLDKDTILMISGTHAFVSPLRYKLLATLGF